MLKQLIIFLLFGVTPLLVSGQSHKDLIVNRALVYGDYNYGIPLEDSSATIIIKFDTENYTDTIILEFNPVGKITRHKTQWHEAAYTYSKDEISKMVKSSHPAIAFKGCSEYTENYHLVNGKIKYASIKCGEKIYRRDYYYSSADKVVSVRTQIGDDVLNTDVFLFDDHGDMQWQSINPLGGIRLNYSCSNKLREYISNLGLDSSIMYAIISNHTTIDNTTSTIKDRYTVSDFRGKKYGEISIERLPLAIK